jgi:hypothetical protein
MEMTEEFVEAVVLPHDDDYVLDGVCVSPIRSRHPAGHKHRQQQNACAGDSLHGAFYSQETAH